MKAAAMQSDQTTHDPGSRSLPYRSDIDGLRAIAVLAVVFYHFAIPGFAGGFVGVDVFFVISGFLIGGILWREYNATGRVRFSHFYIRRFRRLAPAFFVMAFVTTGIAAGLLLPYEFREFGKQLIAATVYLSNVLFFRQSGYFDTASEDKLLLHTWSLAVEEQFYIFLPLFILLFSRSRRALLLALISCWVMSLIACVTLTGPYQTATFYLFPFRAWELLSGVLLAIWGYETKRHWRGPVALSYAGLALIIGSALFIPAGPHFPGAFAIAPVLGTVLLLATGCGQNQVNRLLSNRGAVFVGRISYSLYLWHWPVLTLSLYLRGEYLNILEALSWMALSIGLAWLSWRFVETPTRHLRLPGFAILGSTIATSAVALTLGFWFYRTDGMPQRFAEDVRPHIAASADFHQEWTRCYTPGDGPLMGVRVCPIGPDGDPEVLIWGDSHVRGLKEGLELAALEAGSPGLIIWRAGCPPLCGVRKEENSTTPAQDNACTNDNLKIRQSFSQIPSLERILLIGRWTYYASGTGIGLDADNTIAVHSVEPPSQAGKSQQDIVSAALFETVQQLRNSFDEVIVLRQPPEIAEYDSRIAAREAAHRGWPLAKDPNTNPDIPRAALAERIASTEAPLRAMEAAGEVRLIDPWSRLCDESTCHALVEGKGYYFDNNHMTNTAGRDLRDLFAPLFIDKDGGGS